LEIPKRNPPRLKEPQNWSQEFQDFISCCLIKDPEKRSTAKQLLEHPFITNRKDLGHSILIDLIEEALSKAEEYRKVSEFDEEEEAEAELEGGRPKGNTYKHSMTTG